MVVDVRGWSRARYVDVVVPPSRADGGPLSPLPRPRRSVPVHAQWEDLLLRHEVPAPSHPLALEIFRAHHPARRTLFLPVGEPVAAGAVLRVGQVAGVTTVTSPGEPGVPVALPVDDPGAADRFARELAAWLASRRHGWVLQLGPVPLRTADGSGAGPGSGPGSGSGSVVAALRRHLPGLAVLDGPGMPCLGVGPDDDPLVRVSRNSRAAEHRTLNRAARQGLELVPTWYRSGGDVRARLPEIVALHRRRNRQVRGLAQLDVRAKADYFVDVVARHADAGRAQVLTVDVDDRLAAFAVCLRAGSTAYVYSNLVDPDALALGAGTFANVAVVRHHLAEPWCTELNWGPGVQRYKLSGGARVVPTVELHAASGDLARQVVGAHRRMASRLSRPGD